MLRKLKRKIKRLYLRWDLRRYIKDNLEKPKFSLKGQTVKNIVDHVLYADNEYCEEYDYDASEFEACEAVCNADEFASEEAFDASEGSLDDLIHLLKKPSFTEELIRLVRESGRKDSAIYKAADIDKRLFSKIMSDAEYKPSKDTAVALALALRLSFEEMQDFISRAGYTVTHSSKRDLIIEFFFKKKQYRLMELNDALYRFGEKPLGRTK